MAEPTLARSGGSVPMIESVAGVIARPDAEAEDRLGAADQGEPGVRAGGRVQREAAGEDEQAAGDGRASRRSGRSAGR